MYAIFRTQGDAMTAKIRALFGMPLLISFTYIFLYIPIIVLVLFSCNAAPFPAPWHSFTLHWYKELFHTPQVWLSLANSCIVAFCATVFSIAMSIGLIFYDIKTKKLQRYLLFFYGIIIVPELVFAVGLLSFFSFFEVPLSLPTLIVAHTILGLGYAVPLIYTRFLEMDRRLIEASLDLGATTGQTFIKVIIPFLKPSCMAAAVLIFIISFDDFIIAFFCAGSDAQTLSLYIFSMIRAGISPMINALSTLLLVASSFLVFAFCSLNNRSRLL